MEGARLDWEKKGAVEMANSQGYGCGLVAECGAPGALTQTPPLSQEKLFPANNC